MRVCAEFVGVDTITFSGLTMPMALRLPKPLSDDELIAFSRSIRPYPVERNAIGELEIGAASWIDAARAQTHLICALGNWADEQGGIVMSSQCGYIWDDTSVRMAKASWISEARWAAMPDKGRQGFLKGSPEFLIEMLGHDDSRQELDARMQMWMLNGAQLAWMVDPNAAEVVIYRPGSGPETLAQPEWIEADSIVVGFRVEMARIWAE